jgi:hypothetical protein
MQLRACVGDFDAGGPRAARSTSSQARRGGACEAGELGQRARSLSGQAAACAPAGQAVKAAGGQPLAQRARSGRRCQAARPPRPAPPRAPSARWHVGTFVDRRVVPARACLGTSDSGWACSMPSALSHSLIRLVKQHLIFSMALATAKGSLAAERLSRARGFATGVRAQHRQPLRSNALEQSAGLGGLRPFGAAGNKVGDPAAVAAVGRCMYAWTAEPVTRASIPCAGGALGGGLLPHSAPSRRMRAFLRAARSASAPGPLSPLSAQRATAGCRRCPWRPPLSSGSPSTACPGPQQQMMGLWRPPSHPK